MAINFDTYERSFETAQSRFDGEIDTADHSGEVLSDDTRDATDVLTETRAQQPGFFEVPVDSEILKAHPALFVGRTLLMHNPNIKALSPVVITANLHQPGVFKISRFDVPYDPEVGWSPGMHWSISLATQTRVAAFGGHGDGANGFEQGHFSAALLAARDQRVERSITTHGDRGTHGVLNTGVAEAMGSNQMLPIVPQTQPLPTDMPFRLMAYWHEKLQTDNGLAGGDYPGATRLMLGAGVNTIGETGLRAVERLVKEVAKGA